MSVSLEALAMADINTVSLDTNFEEWEYRDLSEPPPPHLLVDSDEDQDLKEINIMHKLSTISSSQTIHLQFRPVVKTDTK